jgi:hypothetical protein
MSRNTPYPTLAGGVRAFDNAFHVVIIYEDYASGSSALDTYQRLLSEFGREFDFRISVWRLDVMRDSKLMQDAVSNAVKADAIILATRWDELPIEIKQWVDAWAVQKRGQAAVLIALLDSTSVVDRPSAVRGYLAKAAASAGMNFLVQEISSVSHRRVPIWELSGQFGSEGWGLNE